MMMCKPLLFSIFYTYRIYNLEAFRCLCGRNSLLTFNVEIMQKKNINQTDYDLKSELQF